MPVHPGAGSAPKAPFTQVKSIDFGETSKKVEILVDLRPILGEEDDNNLDLISQSGSL